MTILQVQSGDTLSGLARRFGTSVERLTEDNGLEAPEELTPGQALLVLEPRQTVRVRPGDTLFRLARQHETTVDALLRNNPWLTAENALQPGRELTVRFREEPRLRLWVNGYAYPNVSRTLLRRELPFLTTLTVFGCGADETGNLLMPPDAMLLEQAREFGVVPVLLFSSITENGGFSTERASRLFRDPALQQAVLNRLAAVMRERGYGGLDIDFEYVDPGDAAGFLDFIRLAAERMHENGFFVQVDLAPKTSAGQSGLLYEAHDYRAIGAAADRVLLMTYEWGYTYGPPMAIAPLDQVRRVVQYGLSEIPAEKILLGVPHYAYDWTLPFQKGISRAVTVGNQYAVRLAARNGAPIRFNETAGSPWFRYRRENGEHEVWFEDVRTTQAQLQLIRETGLAGLGVWNLMRPFAQSWALQSVRVLPERKSLPVPS